MKSTIGCCVLGILLVIAVPMSHAQTDTSAGDHWQFEISPYLFATALNGTTGAGGITADVDMSFSDISDNIDSAFMMIVEARKGKWGLGFDGIYAKLEGEKSRTWSCPICSGSITGELDLTLTQQIYSLMAAYRLLDTKTKLDVIGTARYTRLDTDVDLSLTGATLPGGAVSTGGFEDWWDPVIGIRVLHPFAENWSVLGYADYGGFGVGSDATYQAMAGVNWHFAKDFTAKLGYRYLYQDYEDNGFVWDMALYGVYAGLGIVF